MISKNLYFNIVIRVIAIVLSSIGIALAILKGYSSVIPAVLLLSIIIFSANLIWYINSTNRKLNFFFEAIKNNDSTLQFPPDSSSRTLRELTVKFNEVNKQIQRLKIDNQQKEQYFQTLLENVATGIITYNSQGFILHANKTAKKMLSVDVLTHIKQLERVDNKLYQTIQRIQPNEHKLVSLLNETGVIELSLNATPFKKNNDELIILSIQDIKNELDARELDSWLKLIRVLMHEIMNSIAPITSLSESLSKHIAKENDCNSEKSYEVVSKGLEVIKTQSFGLMQFVESYRKLTRLPKPEKKLFGVNNLFSQIKLLFDSDCNGKSCIEIKVLPDNLEIFADEAQISQILINLVKNAIQANENNPNTRILLVAKKMNNRVEIEVADNGPGIPKDILEEIFVPFFTTRENGSGIGLSISKQIVRLHGGNIKVKSIPNQETVFSITL